jgi:hypothetical protein
MSDPTYHGDSQKIRPQVLGGEGPWWWDHFCAYIQMDLAAGSTVFVWASALPTLGGGSTGSGFINTVAPGSLYVFQCSVSGMIELDSGDGNGLIAHLPGGALNKTICS